MNQIKRIYLNSFYIAFKNLIELLILGGFILLSKTILEKFEFYRNLMQISDNNDWIKDMVIALMLVVALAFILMFIFKRLVRPMKRALYKTKKMKKYLAFIQSITNPVSYTAVKSIHIHLSIILAGLTELLIISLVLWFVIFPV